MDVYWVSALAAELVIQWINTQTNKKQPQQQQKQTQTNRTNKKLLIWNWIIYNNVEVYGWVFQYF